MTALGGSPRIKIINHSFANAELFLYQKMKEGTLMPKCKYCKETFSPKIVALHEERCKENPKNKPKPKRKPTAKKQAAKKSTTKKQ